MSRRRHPYYRLRVECTHEDGTVSHIDTLKVDPERFKYPIPADWAGIQSFYGVRSIRDRNRYVHEAGGESYHLPNGQGMTKWRGRCDVCHFDEGYGWPKVDGLMKTQFLDGESTVELRAIAAIVRGQNFI